jgi:acetyl esterase/lipase
MSSLRNRLFVALLRKSPATKVVWDENTSVAAFRQSCEEGAKRFGKIPDDLTVSPVSIEGIAAEWLRSSGAPRDKVILFCHGGGYVSGSCADHRVHAAKVVRGSGIAALLFEYRLAPEHPYPAAIEDSVTVYRWLLNQGTAASNIVMAGDSAGGGLCLATLLTLRDRGLPLPAAAVAVSPWTDLKCSGASYRTNAGVCLSPKNSWTIFSQYYVAGNDPALPYISPLYGELGGLPPLLIYAGGDEILLDDAVRFAEKATRAGVDVTLQVVEGMMHCFPFLPPVIPEAKAAMKEICAFIRKHLIEKDSLVKS